MALYSPNRSQSSLSSHNKLSNKGNLSIASSEMSLHKHEFMFS